MAVFLVILAIIVFFLDLIFLYYGGFHKIKISVIETGGEVLIYEKITGDYRKSGAVMDKLYKSLLKEDQIETFKGFAVYFDNPQKVEKRKLRSEAGCILDEVDRDKLDLLKEKYSWSIFPKQKYMTTSFPYRGKISIFFSIMKIYPALRNAAVQLNYQEDSTVMEIYDIPGKKIYFRKSIIESKEP